MNRRIATYYWNDCMQIPLLYLIEWELYVFACPHGKNRIVENISNGRANGALLSNEYGWMLMDFFFVID